jgi:PncC family amidohydrolase
MLTDVSGSSSYIFANFVTYSNEAKNKYLGVQEKTLLENGAVSPETAKEMAEGLIHTTNCDYAIATTGIAGPTGGSIKKPIGLMYIGLATKEKTKIIKVQKNPKLYRRLMKFAFAKEALNEFLIFMKEE